MVSRQQLENKELVFTRFLKDRPKAFYILGVGSKSEWRRMNSTYPEAKLYGVEPHPETYSKLAPVFPGLLIDKAVTNNSEDLVKLYLNNRPDSSSIFPEVPNAVDVAYVKSLTLDELDELAEFPASVVLWMDIEGSELLALKGGIRLLASGRVDLINIELRDSPNIEGWPSSSAIDSLLTEFGYTLATKYLNQITHYDAIYTLRGSHQ